MAQSEQYDVFLSYRADVGTKDAILMKGELEKRGYRVFIDRNGLGAGEFDRQLFQRIDECRDFVLVLSPHSLDRCANERDWVRLELEHAREKGKNIVPVLMDDFSFPAILPTSIEFVRLLNGPRSSMDYFDAFIDRLTMLLQSKPVRSSAAAKPMPPGKPVFVAGSDNVLMEDIYDSGIAYHAAYAKAFSTALERQQISTVTFLDTLADAPKNARDFSQNKNRSVLGWTRQSGDGLYDLYIAGEGGVSAPESCRRMFIGYVNVTRIDFNGAFHTDRATSFRDMFEFCKQLQALDLGSFRTDHVTDMSGMFFCCTSLRSLDVSSFDTSKVTDMAWMFTGCTSLRSLDVSNFDFSHVENHFGFMPGSLDPNWKRYFTRK